MISFDTIFLSSIHLINRSFIVGSPTKAYFFINLELY